MLLVSVGAILFSSTDTILLYILQQTKKKEEEEDSTRRLMWNYPTSYSNVLFIAQMALYNIDADLSEPVVAHYKQQALDQQITSIFFIATSFITASAVHRISSPF